MQRKLQSNVTEILQSKSSNSVLLSATSCITDGKALKVIELAVEASVGICSVESI